MRDLAHGLIRMNFRHLQVFVLMAGLVAKVVLQAYAEGLQKDH